MASSQVFFTNLRTTPTSNLLDKMERLVRRAGIAGIDFENRFAAIKIHFGEPGNMAYLRPQYAARMAGLLRSLGAKPFLTDANTLYSGRRGMPSTTYRALWRTATTRSPHNVRSSLPTD